MATERPSSNRPTDGRGGWRTVGCVVALLGARNLAELVLPDGLYVPTNLGVGAVLVTVARRGGCSWADLGFDRRHVRRALALGGAVASVAVAGMVAAAASPATRDLFDDARVPRGAGAAEHLYQVAVRIPVGTVAFEELAFRGVLLAVLARRFSLATATAVESVLFGLWHIVPTLGTARANGIVGPGRVGLVIASVLVTTLGGLVFTALRVRGGHLLAPAMLHLAFNDTGYLLAWVVRG